MPNKRPPRSIKKARPPRAADPPPKGQLHRRYVRPEGRFTVVLRCGKCRRALVHGGVTVAGRFDRLSVPTGMKTVVEQDAEHQGRGSFICRCGARWTYRVSTLTRKFATAISNARSAYVEVVAGVDV